MLYLFVNRTSQDTEDFVDSDQMAGIPDQANPPSSSTKSQLIAFVFRWETCLPMCPWNFLLWALVDPFSGLFLVLFPDQSLQPVNQRGGPVPELCMQEWRKPVMLLVGTGSYGWWSSGFSVPGKFAAMVLYRSRVQISWWGSQVPESSVGYACCNGRIRGGLLNPSVS